MKLFKHRQALLFLAVACLLTVPAFAMELTLPADARYCFSAEDFTALEQDDGVFITSVPDSTTATVLHGERVIRAGDALPLDALDKLTLDAKSVLGRDATITYYTVSGGKVASAKELRLSILPQKNEPPAADAGNLKTYKNIANTGKFSAADPEGEPLTYQLVKEPKRGTVEIAQDGTYTYTPMENKVGKDSFTYTATDASGNVSAPAKITIEIQKPECKTTYADMAGDPQEYAAMWMMEEGLFTGSKIGSHLCFEPDAPLTRGQFLVMVMGLVEADAEYGLTASGFADEEQTDVWMRPYITTALMNGMISGVSEEDGLMFRPDAVLTRAEAAVMLQNILDLPVADSAAVFSPNGETTVPVWAQGAAAALSQAGIAMDGPADQEPATRRDAAKLLADVCSLLENQPTETFYWVK